MYSQSVSNLTTVRNFLQQHSLIIGIVLMFLYTWSIDLANSGVLPFQVPFLINITLGWGFIFASVLMTSLTLGKDGVVRLLKRYVQWRVNLKWYLIAIFLFPALQSISVLLSAWLFGAPADLSNPLVYRFVPREMNLLILIAPWFVFEMLTNGEEMGWRGYVLPRLQAKYNALFSSLIVGVIWGIWHIPKFLGSGPSNERSFTWFLLYHAAVSVLFTWLYNNSRGSLLLVTLFHASSNTAAIFLPISFSATGGIIPNLMIVLHVLAAIVVTIVAGWSRLSRTEPMQIQQ